MGARIVAGCCCGVNSSHFAWWAHKDSNLEPKDYESSALTVELWARCAAWEFSSRLWSRCHLPGVCGRWKGGGCYLSCMSSDRATCVDPVRPARLRWLWLVAAYAALVLGLIGVVIPGLPTVPFILLASFCAARGSHRLHQWLRGHPRFGRMICEWEEHGAVSRRAKWLASMMMAACSVLMWFTPSPLWAWATGSAIMLCVAIWLWLRPEPPAPER